MLTKPLLVGCALMSLLALSACGKNQADPRKGTLCEKLQERNRTCVQTLVRALHQRA